MVSKIFNSKIFIPLMGNFGKVSFHQSTFVDQFGSIQVLELLQISCLKSNLQHGGTLGPKGINATWQF